jgi:flagellar assembly protein FliH
LWSKTDLSRKPLVEQFVYVPAEELSAPAAPAAPVAQREDSDALQRAAYQQGYEAARAELAEAHAREIERLRAAVNTAIEAFATERRQFFEAVETEVVSLALAIARKILHREAQVDPVLLSTLVHVALARLDESTRVRLRVHPSELDRWKSHFEQHPASHPLDLVADPVLPAGRCRIETDVGSTEIGIDLHLREIEQGFFDLLPARPERQP